jgi:hypothetical protein
MAYLDRMVGLQSIVKNEVGLGGSHWLVSLPPNYLASWREFAYGLEIHQLGQNFG